MNETQRSLTKVLERIIDQVQADIIDAGNYSDIINVMLDELLSNDMFGTEGQNDPRGDQRNGDFTVWEIEDDN